MRRARIALGLSQEDISEIFGESYNEEQADDIDPNSNAGKIALCLISIYCDLFALFGNDTNAMKH